MVDSVTTLVSNIKDSGIRFHLSSANEKILREQEFKFGFPESRFGEIVYHRTYSRMKDDGTQESWHDTVVRVINGLFTIRRWWFALHNLPWRESVAQEKALRMSVNMLQMKWLPPGRGLWIMGTDYIYERGAMALYNCAFVEVENLDKDCSWLMDALMCVTDDTWVSTVEGPRQVKELTNRPVIVYVKGKPYYSETGFFRTGLKKVFEVNAQGFSVQATKNHQFMTVNGWKKLEELKVGDELIMGQPGLENWDGPGTENHGYALGVFIGDGHFSSRTAVTFESYETDYGGEKMRQQIWETVKSLPGRVDRQGWRWVPSKKCWNLRDQELGRIARFFGMERGNKVITPTLEKASSDFYIGFLRGIFDADGSVLRDEKNFRVNLKWSDKESLEAVQRMLARLGIRSTLSLTTKEGVEEFPGGRKCNVKSRYTLSIYGEDRSRFKHLIGFYHTSKSTKLNSPGLAYKRDRTVSVTSITECGIKPVYDIQVKDKHAFDGNGLMLHNCGVGVGFGISDKPQTLFSHGESVPTYKIPDSREGWVESVRILLKSYLNPEGPAWEFNYDNIRKYGEHIKGFGGTSSGPEPLRMLHKRIRQYCDDYINQKINWTHLTANICNAIGACVVAGNVRRSAEICLGSPADETFVNLKNYALYPERSSIGWMSNNSTRLYTRNEFLRLTELGEHIRRNGEPGILNMVNVQKFGRYGHEGECPPDNAKGMNPCGEIPLESYEVCNLAEVFPSRCSSRKEFLNAVSDATFYSSTVSLYPTHSPDTNAVVARNRRIGVSLSGIAEWIDTWGVARCTRWIKDGYRLVREVNKTVNDEAGVVPSLRVTTVKPSGTISQLAGVPSGMHFPTYEYAIRRIIMDVGSPLAKILIAANYPWEPQLEMLSIEEADGREYYEKYEKFRPSEEMLPIKSEKSVVFECPILQGQARPAQEVSAWEQFSLLAMLQREWADNSVSCTVYFDPETEGIQIPNMLTAFVPVIKSVSMLPHTNGIYPQMPYEGITKEEYEQKCLELQELDWSTLLSDGIQTVYCENDRCEINF